MKIDESMVELAARAMWEASPAVWGDYMPDEWDEDTQESRYGDIITWDEFVTYKLAMDRETDNYQAADYRNMARAALTAALEAALGDVELNTDISGEVWSIVLWAMRYPVSANTTEERMAREDAMASVATKKIMALLGDGAPESSLENVLGDRFVLDSVSKNAMDAPGEWAVRVVDLEWPMLPRRGGVASCRGRRRPMSVRCGPDAERRCRHTRDTSLSVSRQRAIRAAQTCSR